MTAHTVMPWVHGGRWLAIACRRRTLARDNCRRRALPVGVGRIDERRGEGSEACPLAAAATERGERRGLFRAYGAADRRFAGCVALAAADAWRRRGFSAEGESLLLRRGGRAGVFCSGGGAGRRLELENRLRRCGRSNPVREDVCSCGAGACWSAARGWPVVGGGRGGEGEGRDRLGEICRRGGAKSGRAPAGRLQAGGGELASFGCRLGSLGRLSATIRRAATAPHGGKTCGGGGLRLRLGWAWGRASDRLGGFSFRLGSCSNRPQHGSAGALGLRRPQQGGPRPVMHSTANPTPQATYGLKRFERRWSVGHWSWFYDAVAPAT